MDESSSENRVTIAMLEGNFMELFKMPFLVGVLCSLLNAFDAQPLLRFSVRIPIDISPLRKSQEVCPPASTVLQSDPFNYLCVFHKGLT